MKLYFVRHGESTANTLHILSDGDLPHPLTELGRQQASRLAEELKATHFDGLYTSPIPRTLETTTILANVLGLTPQIGDGLREIYMGELDGQGSPAAWQRQAELYDAWIERQEFDRRIPGGESFNDAKSRFVSLVTSAVASHNASGNLLLVGHGGIYLSMLPLVLENITTEFAWSHHLSNTAVVIAETRSNKLFCLKWENEEFVQ